MAMMNLNDILKAYIRILKRDMGFYTVLLTYIYLTNLQF